MISLLGEVAVDVGGRPAKLGPARQRCVLAALAVDVGRVVGVDRLISRVWAPDVPSRARATLHTYVSRLRQALTGAEIVCRSGGYVLLAGETDLLRFRELRASARGVDDVRAARLLTEALELWRGEAFTGLDSEWAQDERDRLHGERLAAEQDLIDIRLRTGEGEELLSGLSTRVAEHPLDERVAGQYMLALCRAGRVADALEHYRRLQARLVEELGADPGVPLQELHRRILRADPGLAGVAGCSGPVAVPRQLPAAPVSFVGRRDELDRLDAALRGSEGMVIAAVAGAGGIGKTGLALHWAHRHADTFPDGHLYVDLRGFGPTGPPMAVEIALRGFLDALGVDPGRVPDDPHVRAALFRSVVAGKRMLLVLDNATDTAQVTSLLPGSDSCVVVVTSRNRLSGLITGHGARHVLLDVLADNEAHALLADRLGTARVEAEPVAVAELIALCGGFPLALSIVAGHAHARPHLPLAELAAELRDLGLGALDSDDPTGSLPVVLSWSHNALTTAQARAFALLGAAPGPDLSLAAVAELTGVPAAATRTMLRGLEQASLLTQDARGRYRMHDLIRRYAGRVPERTREPALRRVIDYYIHTAYAADGVLETRRHLVRLDPPPAASHVQPLSDVPAALAWFDTEHGNLLAVQNTATTQGWHDVVWQLAWTLNTFHRRQGHLHDRLATWQVAAAAAEHLPDLGVRVLVRGCLGMAHADLGNHEQASRYLHEALALAERHDDPEHLAHIHRACSRASGLRGDHQRALAHAAEALHLFEGLDDLVWEADALNSIGLFSARLGDHDSARDHCRAALILFHRNNDPGGEADALDSLGVIDHCTGHHTEAVEHYSQAVVRYRALGNAYQCADTLDRLGHPRAVLGQHDQAREVWLAALELYRQQGRCVDAERVEQQLDALG